MDLIETDSSEMCQQVLKQAVLTAGGKAVAMRMVLEKCHHPAVLCFVPT